MKYFKILLLLVTFSSVSSAVILPNMFVYTVNNRCINNDFYYKVIGTNKKFYYRYEDKTSFNSTGTTRRERYLKSGYEFDTITRKCQPTWARKNGLSIENYNFLLGLIGVFFGFVFMFFTIQIFINAGGKR
jgi:hypothetical protein